jgi:hypothetical protein
VRPAVLASLLLCLSVGCLPEEPPAAYAEADEAPSPPPEPRVVSPVAVAHPLLRQQPPSDADRVRPEPVFFRIGAGYGAVGHVDLGPCRERGLDPGYVRMRVTFAGDGTVAHATVESPTPPPPDALACIGERLRAAQVPAFQGGDFTLSKSVFVVSDGPASPVYVERDPAAASPPSSP